MWYENFEIKSLSILHWHPTIIDLSEVKKFKWNMFCIQACCLFRFKQRLILATEKKIKHLCKFSSDNKKILRTSDLIAICSCSSVVVLNSFYFSSVSPFRKIQTSLQTPRLKGNRIQNRSSLFQKQFLIFLFERTW